MSLPLAVSSAEKAAGPGHEISEGFFQSLSILVAEDDTVIQALYKMILKGHLKCRKLKIVADGKSVCKEARNNDYSMVLLDMQMPEMGGLEAAREIRKFNKEIPLILITANLIKSEIQEYKEFGVTGYLTKPFRINDIKKILSDNL